LKLTYRRDIDGLRALSIIAVILYHYNFDFAVNGYLGVDIFFVISGYLITHILLLMDKNLRLPSFLFLFYERRIRRLIPALFVMLLFVTLAAFLLFDHFSLVNYLKSLIYTSLNLSNYFFWSKSSYFDTSNELFPLLHTWSLSVEEQFYIIFPFLVFFLRKMPSQLIVRYISILLLLSALVSYIVSLVSPSAHFYFSITRFWELFAGAYLCIRSRNTNLNPNNLFYSLGFLALLLVLFFLDVSYLPTFVIAVIVVLATALVLLNSNTTSPSFFEQVSSNRFFVFIGLISYSLYLWHQPILAFYKYVKTPIGISYPVHSISFFESLILIFFTVLISIMSYLYIERPYRRSS